MKRLIITCLIAFVLTACDFVPQFYDNNEYLILAEIETSSRLLRNECVDNEADVVGRVDALYEHSELLKTYTFYQPQNEITNEQATIIANNIYELRSKYRQGETPPTEKYCQIKAETITIAAQRVLVTIGSKTRK